MSDRQEAVDLLGTAQDRETSDEASELMIAAAQVHAILALEDAVRDVAAELRIARRREAEAGQ